ncbi:MAG: PAS/PAC sensor signal transduction histidine [Geobacteraceae bacterium]|nr:MAG: PAS/PAC sensor signal transduction histidine [Geobacteraceae bacterium]
MFEKIDEIKAELELKTRQLQACNWRIRTIMTKSRHGIVIVDMSKTVRFANPAAAAIFDCNADELTGTRFDHPLEPDKSAELQIKARDGRTVIVEMWAVETEWDADQAWFVSLRDITESKQAEEALRESEERFRATFNQAAVGIGHVTPDGRWLRINQKYCDIVGYTEEELKALTVRDITHPDDMETSMKHFQLLLEGKLGNYSLEKRYIRKDGSTVWVNLTASVVSDADGNPRFAVGVVEDITPRKRAEEALRFSEARYRALFRDNPIMIVTLDADLTMLSVNPTCASQLGYTTDELEGQPVLRLFHEDDRPAVTEQLRMCLQNPNQVYRWQFRKTRKDGRLVWVEEIAQAVYDLNGLLNVLVVCQDITERKRAEEEIEILNSNLAARASELESANSELEAFNYAVSHDLRRPLTNINSYCQVIRELCGGNLDESCRGYIEQIYAGTLSMNQLIDALLNFSLMARKELHRELVDLSGIARAAAAELAQAAPERRVTFRIAEGIMSSGDSNLLQVVLENLLGNAWKYTSVREEAIIEFGVAEIGGKPACFVRDNGPGFGMADADKLFIAFQRLPGAEEFTGHGIGLATVERIIRRHGGKVWAEGEPGKGATFYFTLPTE